MTATMKLLGAKPAGGFDPEIDITWHSLFWAEGTAFQALGYSDTDNVTSWPNETGESAATGAEPTYDAVNASYNGKPTVHFPTDQSRLTTANFSSAVSAPDSIVVIGNLGVVGGYPTVFDGNDTSHRQVLLSNGAAGLTIGAGGTLRSDGPPDTNPHLFVCQFDGSTGNDTLTIDGILKIDADAGSHTLDGLRIGDLISAPNNSIRGDIALIGIYEGDITADGSWSAFETWAEDHYGLSIA